MNANQTQTISNPILDFFAFLRRPNAETISAPLKQKLLVMAVIVALDILIGILVTLVTAPIEALISVQAQHAGEAVAQLGFMLALAGIFVAPLIEEVPFRLWLAPNPLFFFISFALITTQYAPLPFTGRLREVGLADDFLVLVRIAFYLIIGAVITLFFYLRQRDGKPYADFFRRYVAVYYYVAAIVFGFVHLSNYNYNVEPWWYAPVLILPQLIGGFVFGYIRIRLGFWYAVLAHMATNLLWTLGDGMNALFGETGGVVWLAILFVSSLAVVVMTFRKNLVSVEKALPQG